LARPQRIQFSGAFYHVIARGNGKQPIFLDDEDRLGFLATLLDVCERLDWWVWTYCLMGNHYHLLIQTLQPNLARGMRDVNGVYAQTFNRRHERVGHLFQGRYAAILVQNDGYLREICRYVVLNPVRAHLCATAGDWRWSSHRDVIRGRTDRHRLAITPLLLQFAPSAAEGRLRYIEFVEAGLGAPPPSGESGSRAILGSKEFAARIAALAPRADVEVPRADRPHRPLDHYARDASSRADAIKAAHADGSHTQCAIARHFGLHYTTVSRILRHHRRDQDSRPDPVTIQDLTP
jgi:REP element-mobilizing transposase RayT